MTTKRRHFRQRWFRVSIDFLLPIFHLCYAPELIINCQFEQDILINVMTSFYCSVWSIKVIKWWWLSNTHIIDHYSSFLVKIFFPQKFSDKLKFCRTSNFPKLVVRRTSANFSLIRPLIKVIMMYSKFHLITIPVVIKAVCYKTLKLSWFTHNFIWSQ